MKTTFLNFIALIILLPILAGTVSWHAGENQNVNNAFAAQDSFKNPIADGADPWVIKSGEYY